MSGRVADRAAPRLRIVHVSDCYPPRLGGIEVQVAELTRRQAAAGHDTHVITATRAREDPAGERGFGPQVHRVTAPIPFELPVHPRAGRHLGRLLDELAPDVVHVHVGAVSPFAWAAARCARLRGLPLVATVHSIWDPVTSGIYRLLDGGWRWSRWPLVLAPVSESAAGPIRRAVAGSWAGSVAVRVVPNGLDLDAWRPLPRTSPAGPAMAAEPAGPAAAARPVRLLAVGRLAPRKQPLTLLRLLRAAAARVGPQVELQATIVGDGPAEASMRRYLRRHDMTSWVQLTGRLERHQLPAVLAGADVFLAPAVREAFGLAALEARAAGVPIIARRSTGIADFVADGREGLLADGEAGLTEAIVRLASDHELRERITETNRASAPARSAWPAVLAALDRCYGLAATGVPVGPSQPTQPSRQ